MVTPLPSTPAVDTDFVAFINRFLFNPSPQDSSVRSILRHQRTPPRHKRYRLMWRAAATSLMKKRYSSQETHLPFADHILRELPSQASIDNGNSSTETHFPIVDHRASSDNGFFSQIIHLPSAQQLHRELHSQFSLNSADGHPRNLPSEVSVDDGHASHATHSSSADHRNLPSPSHFFLDDRHSSQAIDSLSTDQLLGCLPSQHSLDFGGGLTTIDSQQYNHSRFDVDALKEAPLITPACSNSTMKGSPLSCYSKVQPLEATSAPTVPPRSSRKPPRPPRASVSRSGSYRSIRLKNAARRTRVDNVRMKKQKLPKSTSNATSMWALIVTLCFASIMLVQGFLGSNSKDLYSKAEGQSVGEGVSSLPSYLGVPPFSSESSTQTFVAEHEAGPSLDQRQQKQKELPLMNLQRHQLRKTSWILH